MGVGGHLLDVPFCTSKFMNHCLLNSVHLKRLLTSCLEIVPKSEPSPTHGQRSEGLVLQWLVLLKGLVFPWVIMYMSMCGESTAGRIFNSSPVDIGSSQDGPGCNIFFFLTDIGIVHSAVKEKVLAGPFDMDSEGSAWAIILAVLDLLVVAGP